MDNRVNFTLVGLYVVLLFMGLVALGLWLSQGRHRKEYNTYQVYFQESVFGLNSQAPVKFNGVVVGYVAKIELNHDNLQQVRLLLEIEEGVPITTTTVAMLKSQGITGISYVGLKALAPSGAPLLIRSDEEYPTIKSSPSFLFEVTDTIRSLTKNVDKISIQLMQLLNHENQQRIQRSLDNIAKTTDLLQRNSSAIEGSLQDFRVVLANARRASSAFPAMADQTKRTIQALNRATRDVRHVALDGQAILHDFKHQTLPGANNLIENMQYITQNLRGFSDELRDNPSIILRGKQARAKGPGE